MHVKNFVFFTVVLIFSFSCSEKSVATKNNNMDIIYNSDVTQEQSNNIDEVQSEIDVESEEVAEVDQSETAGITCQTNDDCVLKMVSIPACKLAKCDPDSKMCILVNAAENSTCDDNVSCTSGDHCVAGECLPTESSCDCESNDDCIAKDDGNKCNGIVVCNEQHECAVSADTVVNCEQPDDKCKKNTCNPDTGKCEISDIPEDGECNFGDPCVAKAVCKAGKCKPTEAKDCDDQNDCTEEFCDSAQGGCVYTKKDTGPCEDHNDCTGNDHCEDGECVGANIPVGTPCDDGNECTVNDECDGNGTCVSGNDTCNKESDCSDGIDNDNNGKTDCFDQQCFESPICNQSTCKPKLALGCGTTNIWSLDALDSSDSTDSYVCSENSYPGNEYTYKFYSKCEQLILVKLEKIEDTDNPDNNTASSLDLFLIDGTSGTCNGKKCIDYAAMGTDNVAKLTFQSEIDKQYYFVVDVRGEGTSKFKVTMQCPGCEK